MSDSVYRERAQLVAALTVGHECAIGKVDDKEPDWWVIFIELPTGQVSWHISDDDVTFFDHVNRTDRNLWDGHDTPEKYRRLREYTRVMANRSN